MATYQSLVPLYWNIRIDSKEALISLGEEKLTELERYWNCVKAETECRIDRLKELITLFDGKTIADIKATAAEYEKPDFPIVGYHDRSSTGGFEPLDEASKMRASDATTLNYCGWCKYARPVSQRYNYNIEAVCELMSDRYSGSMFRWHTPCIFKCIASDDVLRECVFQLKLRLTNYTTELTWNNYALELITGAIVQANDNT